MRETMWHPALGLRSAPVRSGTSGALLLKLLFALCLVVAPRLHERIHADANSSAHECAVTLFASANCENSVPDPVRIEATPAPAWRAFLLDQVSIFTTKTGTSILEHAPPAHS